MTDYTRQLRPRVNKVKSGNDFIGNQSSIPKRKVLREISNQQNDSTMKSTLEHQKVGSKRKINLTSQNHRRCTRSTTVRNDISLSNNVERKVKRRKCDEKSITVMTSSRPPIRLRSRASEIEQRSMINENTSTTRTRKRTGCIVGSKAIIYKDLDDNETKKQDKNFKGKVIRETLSAETSMQYCNLVQKGSLIPETHEVKSGCSIMKKTNVTWKPKRKPKTVPRSLCTDFLADSNFTLVRHSLDPSKYTAGISEFDRIYVNDTQQVSNYVADIYQRLYHNETQFQPNSVYMRDQEEINAMMRAILIDWLVEVHMKFKLVPETLYLCVNIIDRYCSLVEVPRRKLQLVGVTALLLACKYEEIYPPEVRDCVYITDKAYTRQDVIEMEQDIVRTLKFKLTAPTGYKFLVRYLFVLNVSDIMKAAANYYMERTLQEYHFISFRPSLVAAGAVCLAINNPQICTDENAINKNPGVVSFGLFFGINFNSLTC